MKTYLFILICILSMCFFLRCGKDENYDGYYIFGIDANETKVSYEKYTPSSKDTNGLITEFLDRMSNEQEDMHMKKAIPDDVIIDNYVLSEEGSLSVYFNSSYGNYTGVLEILRRAAIVKTLCQIPGIIGVSFMLQDSLLPAPIWKPWELCIQKILSTIQAERQTTSKMQP